MIRSQSGVKKRCETVAFRLPEVAAVLNNVINGSFIYCNVFLVLV